MISWELRAAFSRVCLEKGFWGSASTSTEEFKCAKARLEMTLSLSEDVKVQSVTVSAGSGAQMAQFLEAALRDIVGQELHG